jgi:endonuclease-3 related protein
MELEELDERLHRYYRTETWWEAETPFEVMVGAILTQQTVWKSVDRVLTDLGCQGLLNPAALASVERSKLERLIRPAGFYHQKADRLIDLARYIVEIHDGKPESLLAQPTDIARQELLSLKGIGSETADAILLYASRKPKFVAAAYVGRVFTRTGVLRSNDYDEIQRFVETRLPADPQVYGRLYANLVLLAKTVCKSRPLCEICPLCQACAFSAAKGTVCSQPARRTRSRR